MFRKCTFVASKDSDQSVIRIFSGYILGSQGFKVPSCEQLRPDNVDVQADLSLHWAHMSESTFCDRDPVVQSFVSLMSSLRVISLTVFADSIYNILKFFAEKM